MNRREFLTGVSLGVLGAMGPVSLQASELDDLFNNRLLFDDRGQPLLPVRVMEQQTVVRIRSPGGMQLDFGPGQPNAHLSPGETLTATRRFGQPALVRPLAVLETLEGAARAQRFAVLDTWRKKIADVRLFDVGGVYGVAGSVLDNRAALVVLARDALESEIVRWQLRPTPSEELLRLPTLGMDLDFQGTQVQVGSATRAGTVRVRAANGAELAIQQVEHSRGYAKHGFEDRSFRGEVWLAPDRFGQIAVVNLVPESTLVAGILPSEMFASAPMETLKAQAVTARGEIFAKIGRRHLADPYLVCSAQHCQVYKGRGAEHPRTTLAAQETAGEMAFLDGKLVDSVYSACCGGHTEPAHVVWDQPPAAALMGRPDASMAALSQAAWQATPKPASTAQSAKRNLLDLTQEEQVRRFLALPRELSFCGASSLNQKGDVYRWTRTFDAAELNERLADLDIGILRSLRVVERGPGGRLRSLEVVGSTRKVRLDRELPVRQRFGNLRSGLFVLDEERGHKGELLSVTFRGAGFGHGAGMCQQGAIGMAEAGHSYREILNHYYLGAEVKRVFR